MRTEVLEGLLKNIQYKQHKLLLFELFEALDFESITHCILGHARYKWAITG